MSLTSRGKLMKSLLFQRFPTLIAIVAITVALLLPCYADAQGRGHGRGLSKKPLKFINGHDARAGRWDGRGPRSGFSVEAHRHRGRDRGRMIRRNKRAHVLDVR